MDDEARAAADGDGGGGDFICTVGNLAAGFGDALTLGLTAKIRDLIGAGDQVDTESRTYALGEVSGVATGFALSVASGGATTAAAASGASGGALGGTITGFTKHGINQAISRDGVGVATRAIGAAVRNPLRAVPQSGGRMKYIGQNATVILNDAGKVISTWARNSAAWRIR